MKLPDPLRAVFLDLDAADRRDARFYPAMVGLAAAIAIADGELVHTERVRLHALLKAADVWSADVDERLDTWAERLRTDYEASWIDLINVVSGYATTAARQRVLYTAAAAMVVADGHIHEYEETVLGRVRAVLRMDEDALNREPETDG